MYDLGCNAKIFLLRSYCKERQSFVILFIAGKLLIKFRIAYFLLHCPPYSVLHILFLEVATEDRSLKQVFPKTKQIACYKPATFVKLNSSQKKLIRIFSCKLPRVIFFQNSETLVFKENSGSPCCFIKVKLQEDKMIDKMIQISSLFLNPQLYIQLCHLVVILYHLVVIIFLFAYCHPSFISVFFVHRTSL